MKTDSKDISCKLTTPELQKRKATVIADLKTILLERTELPDGYTYTFQSTDEVLDKLHEFIKSERQCCDFFNFQITIESGFAFLKIYGAKGAKEFLNNEVGL